MVVKNISGVSAYFDFRPSGRGRLLAPGEEAAVMDIPENLFYVGRQVESGRLQMIISPKDFSDLPDNALTINSSTVLDVNISLVKCDATEAPIQLTLPNLAHRASNHTLEIWKIDLTYNPISLLTAHPSQFCDVSLIGIPNSGVRLIPSGMRWLATNL
jgi:hypothetical protein